MTVWVAFLRAVNVGKRQMKMAELKALCEELGYTDIKTILASGNVRFECDAGPQGGTGSGDRGALGLVQRGGDAVGAGDRGDAGVKALRGLSRRRQLPPLRA